MLVEHAMFEKFGGGETSKEVGHYQNIPCWGNNVDQYSPSGGGGHLPSTLWGSAHKIPFIFEFSFVFSTSKV